MDEARLGARRRVVTTHDIAAPRRGRGLTIVELKCYSHLTAPLTDCL
jgi:hypothetical protein